MYMYARYLACDSGVCGLGFEEPLEFFYGVVEVYLEGVQHPSLPYNQSPREDK